MSFEIFPRSKHLNPRKITPQVNVSAQRVVFNKAATDLFQRASGVLLLWDQEAHMAAVKPSELPSAYRPTYSKANNQCYITCKAFLTASSSARLGLVDAEWKDDQLQWSLLKAHPEASQT